MAMGDAGIVFPDGTIQTTAPIDLAAAARGSHTELCALAMSDGDPGDVCVLSAVPAGRILVVEYVSGIVQLPNGESSVLQFSKLQSTLGFSYLAFQGLTGGGYANLISSHPIRMYLDENEQLEIELSRNPADGLGLGQVVITGYYVDK